MYTCWECTHSGSDLVMTWHNLPKPECEEGEITVNQNSKKSESCGPFSASSIIFDGKCYTSTLTSSMSVEKPSCQVHKSDYSSGFKLLGLCDFFSSIILNLSFLASD